MDFRGIPFLAISAMKTATCTVVKIYVTHGILPLGFVILSSLLLLLGLASSIKCGGTVGSAAS